MSRLAAKIRMRLLGAANTIVGTIAAGFLRIARRFDRKKTADALGAFSRRIGPWLPEHRIGRRNLTLAFPEKSAEEIEQILLGVWENLGRFAADFAHLDRITVYDAKNPGPADIEYTPQALDRFEQIKTSGQPVLMFAAHLANWELPALIAHRYGLDAIVLYRRPNLGGVADAAIRIRGDAMGTLMETDRFAAVNIGNALLAGQSAGMLVDQYYTRGEPITFFGQPTRANPLIARLARQVECAIHGTRVIRLPDNRFRVDITEAIAPARNADGRIDIAATMQTIHDVIEGWIREYPDQWLWLHRRWRPKDAAPLSNREILAIRAKRSRSGLGR